MGESNNLLCYEDGAFLDFSLTDVAQLHGVLVACDEDCLEKLESRDSIFRSQHPKPSDYCSNHFRSDAVEWILRVAFQTKSCFGFSCRTAYLAVAYFDRFLAQRSIEDGKPWAARLLSLACVSVAAKMEERSVPTLTDLQSDALSFDANSLQRMELLLLDTLQWRMNSVTPFDYLSYFISKFRCDSSPEESSRRAIDFIFTAINMINLAAYRSSAIAAAAVLAASSKLYAKEVLESKISSVSMFGSCSEKEHVFFCYKIMTRDPSHNDSKRRSAKRPSSSTEEHSSITEVSDSAPSNLSMNKRRRLRLADTNRRQP
ncbi:hypothetical protein ZIOFF_038460 [Zingiber officinale]|uniref:Uncharacterized protein n=1 Tax=Zingiber officinale TaxID=94328 RepID=A0A8J5G0L6_ZINOF|nr:hypothetical protein ZIOFF_038460 [Zingiber officinale]